MKRKIHGIAHYVYAVATLSLLIGLGSGTALEVSVAHADSELCPNAQIRRDEPDAQRLPDCRAYEQVSPVEKNDANALGRAYLVEASPFGEAVTYFSLLPFPGTEGSGEFPTYLSSFNGGAWSTQGLLPSSNPASPTEVEAMTEDLRYAIVVVGKAGPLLGEALITGEEGTIERAKLGEFNTYLRDEATGAYSLLAPGDSQVRFAESSANDSDILFEDRAKLTTKASSFLNAEGEEPEEAGTNLYEWKEGTVTLVGVLSSDSPPTGGAVAGPGGAAIGEAGEGEEVNGLPGGATSGGIQRFDLQNTISEDGSRVFFTDVGTGEIYMREPAVPRTLKISGSQAAYWRAATRSGSYVFYTEGSGTARKLYRFDVERETSEDLTPEASPQVLGVVGISQTGSYAYYVAHEGALYEWHEGQTLQIAKLDVEADINDWTIFSLGVGGAEEGEKSSRVTPGGTTILFSSHAKITGYNNEGLDELYVYNATLPLSSSNPVCVSCNPHASSATEAYLAKSSGAYAPINRNGYLTNNLSDEGTRVFFQSKGLLPEDEAETTSAVTNVYEWEREGAGSCAQGSGNGFGGCLSLISSGQSPEQSLFGDASVDGSNVFFFTRQSLVSQDQDENVDVYDAKENGGLSSQNVQPLPPCAGEACRGPAGSTPMFGSPSTVMPSGTGNLAPPPARPTTAVNKPKPKSRAKRLTHAQKLAKALHACRTRPRRQQQRCRMRAHREYGTARKVRDRGGSR